MSDFFWDIICNSSDIVKEDLVNSCISKFCEMVKNWDMTKKHNFFIVLVKNLADHKSSISSIRLFKGLVKDQKDRLSYGYSNSPQRYPNLQSSDQAGESQQEIQQELTLYQSLSTLIHEHGLIQIILENLKHCCDIARSKVTEAHKNEQRKKVYLLNSKYTHHEEIDERLQFLKYIA